MVVISWIQKGEREPRKVLDLVPTSLNVYSSKGQTCHHVTDSGHNRRLKKLKMSHEFGVTNGTFFPHPGAQVHTGRVRMTTATY